MTIKVWAVVGSRGQNVQATQPSEEHILMEGFNPSTNELTYEAAADGTWVVAQPTEDEAKLLGVEFLNPDDGLTYMLSATKDDMFGLASVKEAVLAGLNTNFYFENDTVVRLTPTNMLQLQAVWIPFRASFF